METSPNNADGLGDDNAIQTIVIPMLIWELISEFRNNLFVILRNYFRFIKDIP